MVTVLLRNRHCHCFEREGEIEAEENLSAMDDKVGEGTGSIYLFFPLENQWCWDHMDYQ